MICPECEIEFRVICRSVLGVLARHRECVAVCDTCGKPWYWLSRWSSSGDPVTGYVKPFHTPGVYFIDGTVLHDLAERGRVSILEARTWIRSARIKWGT